MPLCSAINAILIISCIVVSVTCGIIKVSGNRTGDSHFVSDTAYLSRKCRIDVDAYFINAHIFLSLFII